MTKRKDIKFDKLNVGCGTDIRKGYVNVDKYNYEGIDFIQDLDNKLDFKDNEFEEILAQDIIEHVTDVQFTMLELSRILKKNGVLKIRVPHYNYRNAYQDITHKTRFSLFTFDCFVKEDRKQGELYNLRCFNSIKRYLQFEKRPIFFYNYILEFLVNLNSYTQNLYERTPLIMFPCQNIMVELKK